MNIQVPQGSIYGFLGPNGAGKSTTMQLMTGILEEYTGTIDVFGESLKSQMPKIFNKIGVLVETPSLYYHLNGIDNLRVITTLKNIAEEKIPEILELVGLAENGKEKVKQYSLGMRQRLAIAMTLLGDPELLFLDEPVNGLDPAGMAEVRRLLVKLNQERDLTIFISSHLLSEIEKMCTHLAIINKGSLIYEGTMAQLSEKTSGCQILLKTSSTKEHLAIISLHYPSAQEQGSTTFSVTLRDHAEIPLFSKFLVQNDIPIYELKIVEDLENEFLNLTSDLKTTISAL